MSRNTEKIFSYGTLQDPEIQLAIFKRLLQGQSDTLSHYRLLKNYVYDQYPVVVPEQEASTTGVTYDLEPGELALADAYEGPGYRRALLRLDSGVEAWVYLENRQDS